MIHSLNPACIGALEAVAVEVEGALRACASARARILLLADEGRPDKEIAATL